MRSMTVYQVEVSYTEYIQERNGNDDHAGWIVRPNTHKTIRLLAPEYQQDLVRAWVFARFKYHNNGGKGFEEGVKLKIHSIEEYKIDAIMEMTG